MDKLMTIDDVCYVTGLRPSTIYIMVSRKRIPFVKISGRCVRFREEDIKRWIDEKVVQTKAAKENGPANTNKRAKKAVGRGQKSANASLVDAILEEASREVLS